MLLPFPTFIRTQIPIRKKIVILGLFALGIFITVVQIIRFHSIKTLVNLVDSASPITWSIVEGNLGVITTCIPTLAPLVRYFSDLSRLDGESGRERCGTCNTSCGGSCCCGGGGGGIGSRDYALGSLQSGLRGGVAVERSVMISGNHSRGSIEVVHDPNGITKRTELVVRSSNGSRPDEARTSEDELTGHHA